MADEQEKVQQPALKMGQIVYYQGIVLRVTALHADGRVEACNSTLRVTGTPDEYKLP